MVREKGSCLWYSNGLNDSFSKSGLEKERNKVPAGVTVTQSTAASVAHREGKKLHTPAVSSSAAASSAGGWHCHTVAA